MKWQLSSEKLYWPQDIDRYNVQRQNSMNGMRMFSTEYLAREMRTILADLELTRRAQKPPDAAFGR
jgi:hypothetical protein